jgi:hypothetical protein
MSGLLPAVFGAVWFSDDFTLDTGFLIWQEFDCAAAVWAETKVIFYRPIVGELELVIALGIVRPSRFIELPPAA